MDTLIYGKHPDICMYGYCELKRVRMYYGCIGHNRLAAQFKEYEEHYGYT